MKAKRVLVIVAMAFVTFNLGLVYVTLKAPVKRAQKLVLPDGSTMELKGVTFGTNHMVGGHLARMIAKAPGGLQRPILWLLGERAQLESARITSQPKLLVWFEISAPTNQPTAATTNKMSRPIRPGVAQQMIGTVSGGTRIRGMLANQAGFMSGQSVTFFGPAMPAMHMARVELGFKVFPVLAPLEFEIFPRRSPKIELHIFQDSYLVATKEIGSLQFANPVPGHYPQWRPEPLPAVRQTDGVEVVVKGLRIGEDPMIPPQPRRGGPQFAVGARDRQDGFLRSSFEAELRGLSGRSESWVISGARISDATGNVNPWAAIGGSFSKEIRVTHFEPCLWPDEDAWKVQFEIKQERGFQTNDLVVIQKYPLPAINRSERPMISVKLGNLTFTLAEFSRKPPAPGRMMDCSYVSFNHSPLPAGVNLSLVSVVQDAGQECRFLRRPPPHGAFAARDSLDYSLPDLSTDAQTVDITFAIQRTRTVELLLKPEVTTVAGK
jgi:hypothetical protein